MKLIRGAPGSGKTALVFREFKAALKSGNVDPAGLRIVVPTATLVRHFRHELARDGVVFPPHAVISLNRFAREHAALTVVPPGLLRAIVRDAVTGAEGLVATIIDTIDLFENAGATPDKLACVRKPGPQAKAFEKLWRTVGEAVRERGYLMRSDLIRAAAANARPARLWLDGFLNFSPLEREFVRSLVLCPQN